MVARKSLDPDRPASDLAHLQEPGDYKDLRDENNARRRPQGIAPDNTDYWSDLTGGNRYVWTDDYSNLLSVFRWPWRRGTVED